MNEIVGNVVGTVNQTAIRVQAIYGRGYSKTIFGISG